MQRTCRAKSIADLSGHSKNASLAYFPNCHGGGCYLTNDDCRDQHPLSVDACLWRKVCTKVCERVERVSETLEQWPQHWHCKDRVIVWQQWWLGYRFGTGTNLSLGVTLVGGAGLLVTFLDDFTGLVGFGIAASAALA